MSYLDYQSSICRQCGKSDRLYSDDLGTFCSRCGPHAPVEKKPEPDRTALQVGGRE